MRLCTKQPKLPSEKKPARKGRLSVLNTAKFIYGDPLSLAGIFDLAQKAGIKTSTLFAVDHENRELIIYSATETLRAKDGDRIKQCSDGRFYPFKDKK